MEKQSRIEFKTKEYSSINNIFQERISIEKLCRNDSIKKKRKEKKRK
jgi:hypothetical protein